MERLTNWVLCCLLVLAVVSLGVWGTDACSVIVHPGASIQEAIDAAPEGAVICLGEGFWEEHITVGKSLTLRKEGVGRPVIRPVAPHTPVVRVAGPGDGEPAIDVVLKGITVSGARGVNRGFGVLVEGVSHVLLEGVTLVGSDAAGLWLSGSSRATVRNSTIAGNHTGISAGHTAQLTVRDTLLAGNHDGVMLWGRSQATMVASLIANNGGTGVFIGDEARVTVTDCTVSGSGGSGIRLWASAEVTLEGNDLLANGGFGVALDECPCQDVGTPFTGYLSGVDNTIAGPEEANGNAQGAFCPEALRFLITEDGGTLDRRR